MCGKTGNNWDDSGERDNKDSQDNRDNRDINK